MEQKLSTLIFNAAVEVHQQLGGPGLLESIYESALCYELSVLGLQVQRQIPIPVLYKNTPIREPLYLDLLVEKTVIIEVKATARDFPFYQAQLQSHLRLLQIQFGMLVNFGKTNLKDGISHVINPLYQNILLSTTQEKTPI